MCAVIVLLYEVPHVDVRETIFLTWNEDYILYQNFDWFDNGLIPSRKKMYGKIFIANRLRITERFICLYLQHKTYR